jgi:predicted nucleotidyltransferase
MSVLRDIFHALEARRVRYVVVGGVAVTLHGYLRATKDLDLVIDLRPEHARAAMAALTASGLEPRVPVSAVEFADPLKRRMWIEEKNMLVFQMIDRADARRSIDIFVEEPIPFDELWARSALVEIDDVEVHVASIDDLIVMKERAGRPQDIADIAQLQRLRRVQ